MNQRQIEVPDSTAVRTALWRALHVQLDSLPHVFEDVIGLKLITPEERARIKAVQERAKAAGTPFMSSYSHEEMLTMAREAGFKEAKCLSTAVLPYFDGRLDGLCPSTGESILVASI